MSKAATNLTNPLPYSWDFDTWPADVFPFNGRKARHIVRQHLEELNKAGAVSRPGHKIIVLGAGYAKWLASKASRVMEDYRPAPNLPEHAHKRAGAAGKAARARAEANDDAA